MRSITEYLPWALLAVSLWVISADALQAERIQFGPDQEGFCQTHSEVEDGTRLQLSLRNQHWIWVSCSEPKKT